MKNYFEKYSDEELINIVSQLDKKVYPENSIIRKITKDIFNTENPIHFLMIAVPLSKELAIRLNSVSPHIKNKEVCCKCGKLNPEQFRANKWYCFDCA
jgi:hypothetical protein